MKSLTELEYTVLSGLAAEARPVEIGELAERLGMDQAKVAAVCLTRAESGEVTLEERPMRELRLGPKGKAVGRAELPERTVVAALGRLGGSGSVVEVAEAAGLDKKEVGQSLSALAQKGWAKNERGTLKLQPAGENPPEGADEALFAALVESGQAFSEAELAERGIDLDAAFAAFARRKGFVELRQRMRRHVALSEAGQGLIAAAPPPPREVNQLSPEMLQGGSFSEEEGALVWTDEAGGRFKLRPYDVSLAAETRYPGREHPLVSVFAQTRRVFLEMGFEEIVSPYVESSFWDFDALFQPQDHPARDMQDTFYIGRPARCRLPDEATVQAVARTHQDGGETGSVGWRYRWDRELAGRPVLRTHTTAATVRALARDPKPPRKVFLVGPVFRRETVDYKHLPVFHQVDGVVIDEQASFATLLGTLEAFYRKMGFDRFDFRPAFFPYTEPSVEVFVWSETKKDWVEMGGAGMFRPEVTEPLGCEVPVLAWGLGLERLAMFRYHLSSIGELYRARLSWLKETPLCR